MYQKSVFSLSYRALFLPCVLAAAVDLMVLSSVASAVDCSDDLNNLIRNDNCDFDTDVSGWVDSGPPFSGGGTLTHVSDDGVPVTDGAAHMATAPPAADPLAIGLEIGQCFNQALPAGSYTVRGSVRSTLAPTANQFILVGMSFHSGANCGGSLIGAHGTNLFPVTDQNWHELSRTQTYAASVSQKVIIICNDFTVAGMQCNVDNLSLVPNFALAVCGNGTTETGEDCDDGNTNNGDCCSSTCAFESSGTNCGNGPTECSGQDTCNGAGACQTNNLSSGTNCGDAGTECVNQDTCDGSGSCTDNGFVGSGTNCGAAATECSGQDTCNGAGACQANNLSSGTNCGDAGTECVNQDTCNGSGSCTDNGFVAVGTACDDGNACTTGDVCLGDATCAGTDTSATDCDDGNVCTDDTCDPGLGCQHVNNTASCDDGDTGTTNDTCSDGLCVGETPADLVENVIDAIQELLDTNEICCDNDDPQCCDIVDALEDALDEVQTALEELNKTPADNEEAMGAIEEAVEELEEAVADGLIDPDLMDQLAEAARTLAADAIQEAIDLGQGSHPDILLAQQDLADGDILRAAGAFEDAMSKYLDALENAEDVIN